MSTTDAAYWRTIAASIVPEARLLIDGSFCDAADMGRMASTNPANGKPVAELACGTADDVERAADIAERRFRQGVWSRMALRDRMAVMFRLADLVEAHAATFAVLDTLEMGKPISEMLTVDVPGSVLAIRYLAECIDKIGGSCPTTNADALHYMLRQPLGVVGCITPWNYPLMMAAWKVAPALAAGNSVVLKPAEDASLSAILLGKLFLEAGGPDGVFNVVPGRGAVAGKALALSDKVHKIAFTGSTGVGRLMYRYSADSNLKKVSVELGGKSPQIILDDAGDLQKVADWVVDGIYGNQGEVCSAGSRILVGKARHDDFVDLFRETAMRKFQPGNPLDPATTMGPLVNRAHQQKVLGFIDGAGAEGATRALGGEAHLERPEGCFVSPTLFTSVRHEMTIASQEVFGPVAAVIRHDGPANAVMIANDTPYGLSAGIWTNDLTSAHSIARDLECGMVWVNGYMNGDMSQPWGGWKASGQGRDKAIEALLENTQMKSVWVTLSR
ncbi:aldehyde dehydrogenase family protein [Aminobacter aminovorans]|uniref:aldehyde dehydrogenase family protein n=1 Tax=Aminobacter aminovorans TaxID=83263 RepID=UPI00285F6999|nr:aldehyde dehydrogenase family protein [Aminobacter aminovorans]MDR7223378.1 gamma-glutamyl-gamma-aminobutyraldehyde dehydrogenase [Aminobacter aminovorans]